MEPVRIACVRYLNTVPLIEGLEKLQGVALLPTIPSRIAGMVAGGEADVGLVSLVDAVRSPVPLALLPCGMIGCDGPTLTVRLFSSVPLAEVRTLHADTDSHTSVVLARVLLDRLFGARPEVAGFDAGRGSREDWPETVLLIGDKVVTNAPPAERYPHQLDLGEAWKGLTGLPFVYAVWMCRADRAGEPPIATAAAVLDRQRRHNRGRLAWIVANAAAEHRWPLDLAQRYLGSLLRYEVGEREREAAARFVQEASALRLVEERGLVWAEGAQTSN
ncbi:MAG: menaquinone biosynthesis protein [Phycisphaerales bacterium]